MSALIGSHRLVKLCGMFGSDHPGERATAAAMADQLVRKYGLTWDDVIRVEAHWDHNGTSAQAASLDWRAAVRFCNTKQHRLSPREFDFIVSLARWRGEPTPKQRQWLSDIAARLRGNR